MNTKDLLAKVIASVLIAFFLYVGGREVVLTGVQTLSDWFGQLTEEVEIIDPTPEREEPKLLARW